ncbi:nitroreductase family protein [Lishizhenia sp.]|uniref:nitroreductase family protein n=1 Tax=Lishizhenia sp. TaxID=2497594 RepID=UPI00299EE816|nr:nitroreductase family protein [Lishizhenia sp.]MDX1445191.1 nitroreductase family protein [Lishizhenia sp.]
MNIQRIYSYFLATDLFSVYLYMANQDKDKYPTVPYESQDLNESEMLNKSKEFFTFMDQRRSVRDFADTPVPKEVVENIIMTASTAPSGAHKQPWTFCLISNKELKSEIRKLAEEEEYKSYNGRMKEEWLKDLAPLGTDWQKEFIEIVPWIIVVMKKPYDIVDGKKKNNYYVNESVGLAAGFLLAAIHNAGLVSLTHTPSPMNFLIKALNRPENERPFLLIPVGYPKKGARVPDLKRKAKREIIQYYE